MQKQQQKKYDVIDTTLNTYDKAKLRLNEKRWEEKRDLKVDR